MKLYRVQDDDRPMHVLALDFEDAVRRWRAQIAQENPEDDCSDEYPEGVCLIAQNTDEALPDLLLPARDKKALALLREVAEAYRDTADGELVEGDWKGNAGSIDIDLGERVVSFVEKAGR